MKLWEHQSTAIELSQSKRDLALFWEMGTGKTRTAIEIILSKFKHNERVMRTLILAPPIVLKNWQDEFKKYSNVDSRAIVILSGSGKKREKAMNELIQANSAKIIITNYESMQMEGLFNKLLNYQFEILVADESHRCKNYRSKRAKRVAQLSKDCKHRYLLTGTPMLNSMEDLFQQFKVLDGGETFGENFFGFRGRYFYDQNASWSHRKNHFPNFVPKKELFPVFSEKISRKSTRVKKADCLDLPPLVKETRQVELSREQLKMYKEMRDEFVTFIEEKEKDGEPRAAIAQLALTKVLRLQQIVTGFVTLDDSSEYVIGNNPRLKVLRELFEEITPDNKLIVWCCFKHNYKQIAALCDEIGVGYTELHGGIRKKDENIEKFREDDNCKVMIANQASAGIGVNLVEAAYSVYYSKSFSLEHDFQSEARNYRGGSEIHQKVTRIDLIAPNTIDELIMEALDQKLNVAETILDWKKRL